MKAMRLATTRTGTTVLHTVPEGNGHALCGVVVTKTHEFSDVLPGITDGSLRTCKNCLRVKPARDHNEDTGEPTDTWSVTDRADNEIARVHGDTMAQARDAARRMSVVRDLERREGGFSLRRMRLNELRAAQAVDALMESTLPTMTLHTVLHRQAGVSVEGRRAICAELAARGITPARVRASNA